MKKKLLTLILTGAMVLSLVACGSKADNEASSENGSGEMQEEQVSSEEASDETSSDTPETTTYNFLYGWEINEIPVYQPEGALVTVNGIYDPNYVQEENVITNNLLEFYAPDESWYARVTDWCSEWDFAVEEIPQYYWHGELNEDMMDYFDDYSQTVTELEGLELNGEPVIYIQTFEEGEPYDAFVGIEYNYSSGSEDHGKGLLGLYLYWSEPLTQEQCAWLFGEAFGVETGISNPFAEVEEAEEVVVNVNQSELLGTWLEPESSWENTYTFNADGTGCLVSGPQYPFSYEINGSTLTLIYEEDDIEEFEVVVNGDSIILIDQWEEEHKLERTDDVVETTDAADAGLTPNDIDGTWKDVESKFQETFTFNTDETGLYTYEEDGTHYEYEFTYWIASDSDVINISYEDGDKATFYMEIDGDSLIFDKDWILTRQ